MRISDWSSDVCSSDLIGARRARAVPAGVGDFEREVGIGLLARLQPVILRLAILGDQPAAAIAVQCEFGTLIFGGERARRRHRGFLVAREQQDDRPLRLERSEEHTSELQSLMRISYAVFCLKKKNTSEP